ncbi:hypothetical protein [Streptomyces sp. NPDC004376]
MTGQSPSEVAAMAAAATALYAVTFPPAMRLARAEHVTPAWLRALPAATARAVRGCALAVTALLLLLTLETSR